eukprot:SAG31_NODE_3795_length_3876_cov_2.000794_1_plen_293_part_00
MPMASRVYFNFTRQTANVVRVGVARGVIQRTVTILEGRCSDMDGFITEQEKKAGVVGFTRDQDALEKASSQKAESDHRKGLTLQEHSQIVEKTRLEINEKKKKLAPMIKELRAARGKFQELEMLHTEKKNSYDQIKLKYDMEFEVLNTDSDGCRADIEREESQFHHLNCLSLITQANDKRAKQEVRNKTSGGGVQLPTGRTYDCYRDMLDDQLKVEADNKKVLREQQSWVKENHEGNLRQMKQFQDLHTLLSMKLQLARTGEGGGMWDTGAAGQGVVVQSDQGMANVFTLDD